MRAGDPERANWQLPPEKTTVLLVVVDEHKGYAPPAGIADQAARFAGQLITRGVPPARVKVLVSEAGWMHFPAGCERLGPALLSDLAAAIQSIPEWDSGLLWMHWVGHGFYDDGQFMLLTADARQGYEVAVDLKKELFNRLELARGTPARQMFTIDACQVNAKVTSSPLPRFDEGSGPNAGQFWLFGSRPGKAASLAADGGLFTAALMHAIDAVAEPAVWPPDHDLLIAEVTEHLSEALGGRTDQLQYLTKQPRDGDEQDRRRELTRSPAVGVRSLVAWPVPADWQPGSYSDELCLANQVTLALRLVVNRRRALALVADPADADLASDLNQAEEDFHNCGLGTSRSGALARRVWFTIDIWRSGEPTALRNGPGDWVIERRRWQQSIQAGFVLRISLAEGRDDYRRVHALAHSWVQRLRQEHPDASIVITTRTRYPADGILAIRTLASQFPADGPFGPQPFTRSRPGEPVAGEALDDDPLDTLAGPPYLPALLSQLRIAAQGRHVALPFPPTGDRPLAKDGVQSAEPNADRLAPLADALLSELEDPACQLPTTAGRDGDELLLCSVRDLLPALFPPLLRAYAARRTGHGWGVSLAIAAQFDEDISAWLTAANDEGRSLNPRDQSAWPPAGYRKAPADAVALEMMRRHPPADQPAGQPWHGEAWLRLTVSPVIAEALQVLRRDPGPGKPPVALARSSAGLIEALAAALLDPEVLLAPPVDPYSKQTWWALRAVVVRSPASLWRLLPRLADGKARDFTLSVLGVEPLPDEEEPLLAEKASELNRILYSITGALQ